MRHLLESVARALHDRRELAVALATAIVAAALIVSGQGNLAAVVTMGTAGFMAGRARQYRLAAQFLRRQVNNVEARAARASTYREEARAHRRHLLSLVSLAREHLDSLRMSGARGWYAPHLNWQLERAEKRLAQAVPAELLTPEEIDELYAGENREVNTTDTTTAEE